MGKRKIVIFFAVMILVLSLPSVVFADDEFEYQVLEGAVAVVRYKGGSEKAEIPQQTDDGTVKVILSGAFKESKNLKSVVIPESVVKIEEGAFEGCDDLKDVYFEGSAEVWNGVHAESKGNESFLRANVHFTATGEKICEGEFFKYRISSENEITVYKCKNGYQKDTKITFPSKIDDMAVIGIDEGAFANCVNVSEIRFEEGIRYIDKKAFMNCSDLKKIDLPASLERIGKDAFTETAFYRNSADGSIYIDGWYCVYKGEMPEEADVRIQRNTKGVADFAFYGNKYIVNVFFPKGIGYIGNGAFSDCIRLSEIFFEGGKNEWHKVVIGAGNDNISEKNIRYNTTIDNYSVEVYKGLCITLLIITGVLVAVLVYCIARIVVQNRIISYLDEALNTQPVPEQHPHIQRGRKTSHKRRN